MDSMVIRALRLACVGHAGQVRFDGMTPFVYHCVCVMQNTAEDVVHPHALATALLHDLLEDTDCTLEDFPREVQVYVEALTARGEGRSRKMDALKKLEFIKSPIAIIVKMADRRHNLEDDPKKKKFAKYKESTKKLLDMAHERGLGYTKNYQELYKLYMERIQYVRNN